MQSVGLLAIAALFAAAPFAPPRTSIPIADVRSLAARDTARLAIYDLEIRTDDGTMTGELSLKRQSDSLVAVLRAGGNTPSVKSFVRDGPGYVLTAGHGDFTVVYRLTFKRDSLSGTYVLSSGLSGTVIGAVHR